MKLLSFLFVAYATAAIVGGVTAAAGDPHANEHQNTPLWVNIPVPPSDLNGVLANTGLTADVYTDGNAYVQIMSYNLDKLQTWLAGNWVDITITPGWVTKLNILVQGPKGPGYMIHDIDFQTSSFSGAVRTLGAVFDQKIPSHMCSFTPGYSTSSNAFSFNFGCSYVNLKNNIWNWIVNDGFQGGPATYTQGAGNGITTDAFVRWAVVRNNKYEKQNDGTVVWADVTKPGVSAGLDQWYTIQPTGTWSASILNTRLGLSNNYPICSRTDKNYCFWGSYYGLIDHENTVIKAKTNDIAVDGAVTADDATVTTSSTSASDNMIWLYGIVVGAAAAIAGALTVYAIMTYRARGQQVMKATQQHVAVEMP